MATWSWSTSLRALVSAVAVTPSVSSTISSIFRPATCRLISSRYSSVPLCMSLPRAEAAPVSGTRRPILMGPPWATAGTGAVPADTSASSRTITAKRAIMTSASFRSAPAAAERADDAVRSEQDHADVDGAENEEPALRVHAHEVLEKNDDAGADRRTDERARAAERGHQERLDGRHKLDVSGADEAVVIGPQDAGHSREGAGQHEGHVLVKPHVVAQGLHARLAPADALEAQAEGRDDDEAEHRPDRGRDQERKVEEWQRSAEGERAQLGPRHAGDAVVPLGQRHPPERESPDDHAQRERDHEEVGAARADGDEAEDRRGDGRQRDAGRGAAEKPHLALGGEERHHVGGDAEIRRLAERRQARVAQEHVEAHREDAEDERLGDERQRIGRHHRAQGRERTHDDDSDQRAPAYHAMTPDARISPCRRARWGGWPG